MKTALTSLVVVATGVSVLAGSAVAAPEFKAPVRLKAGDKFMGGDRYYPSPVFRDMNGDGKLDIVVGDLRGFLTVAQQGDKMSFGAESKIKDAEGKDLKFSNW